MKKNIAIVDGPPNGSNKLGSRANFIQKRYYHLVYEKIKKNLNVDFFDLRNEFAYYLKYDANNNPINITEARLKNIDTDIYVADVVADAFIELKRLCANSKLISEQKLKDLKPKKGWESLHKKYHNHADIIYKNYIQNLMNLKKDKKILNFDDFIVSFVSYLDLVAYKTPFLKSSYLLSRDYSPSDTGFMIEIDNIKKDKDRDKVSKYLTNYSYEEFVKLCNKTGFAIDKDCPWRLIFKAFSPEAEKYFQNYEINSDIFINQYFYNTREFDLENLKNYFIIFYNTFVKNNPSAHNPKIITHNETQITVGNIFDRTPAIKEQVDLKYNELFWFNIYCHISFVENKLDISNQEYKSILKNLLQDFQTKGKTLAFKELDKFISNTKNTETKGEYKFELPPRS